MSNHVKEFWEHQAEGYVGNYKDLRRGTNFNFRKRLEEVCTMTAGLRGSLLDCAIGTGEVTFSVLSDGRFSRALLVDVSEPMLETARRAAAGSPPLARAEFVCADAFEQLATLRGAGFDLILCLGLIAHTGRLEELLSLAAACLAPGGSVILQTSLLDHPGFHLLKILSAQRHLEKKGYAMHYYHERDVLRAADLAGLKMVQRVRFGLGIPYGDRICAPVNYWLERAFAGPMSRHGCDAIYRLRKPDSAG